MDTSFWLDVCVCEYEYKTRLGNFITMRQRSVAMVRNSGFFQRNTAGNFVFNDLKWEIVLFLLATKIFNYQHMLHLNIDDFKSILNFKTCASSSFIYNPADHVITGDLKIINDTSLQDVFTKGPKYREPKSINWKHNFRILMDSIEDYARQREKREKEDLNTLSEWVKSVRSLYTN